MQSKAQDLGRVVVLMGGMSSERDVSIMSGTGVLNALVASGVDATAFDPGREPIAALAAGHYDRAFIALHGRFGEDGAIQGVLEFLQLPYTGPGVRSSAIAIDKVTTRTIWAEAGLPVARGCVVHRADQAAQVLEQLGSDVVVKPSSEGSSIGVTKLSHTDEKTLTQALEQALALDESVLVEERWFGRELTIAILDGKALPIIEIKAPEGDYDYQNKYFGDAVKYDCPARLDAAVEQAVCAACEKAFAVLQARGWGRIDVMLADDGSFILLELNTSPGMTPHSLVPMAARAVGMSYEALVLHVAGTAALDHRLPASVAAEQ